MKLLFALLVCVLFASVAFATSFAVVENTEYCLGTCQTVFEITPSETITIPPQADASYYFDFFKDGQPVDYSSYSFEVLRQSEEQIANPVVVEVQHIVPKDSNISDCAAANLQELDAQNCYYTSQELDHYEYSTVQKEEWVPFAYWGETLEAGKTYKIRMTGTKLASLGNYSLQLKSSFGSSPAEPQSWAGGWMHRKIVKVKNNYNGTLLTNNSLAIDLENDFDLEQCALDGECQGDGEDIRLAYQDSEIPYFIEYQNGKPKYLWFQIQAEITGFGVDDKYYLYYSNPNAIGSEYEAQLPLPAPDSYTHALYHFDEGTGTRTSSYFGNPDVILTRGDMWTGQKVAGDFALSFNGIDSYGRSESPLNEPTMEGSVEFWLMINHQPGFAQQYGLIGNAHEGLAQGYLVSYFGSPDKLALRLWPGEVTLWGMQPLEIGRWYHVATSWGNKGMKIYLDGVLLAEHTNPYYPTASTIDTHIGSDSRGYPNPRSILDGFMDEVRISSKTINTFPQIIRDENRPTILALETSPDEDGDGAEDWADDCLATPEGEEVSLQGCSCSQLCVGWGNPCYDNTCNLNQNACTSVVDNTNTCGIERTCGKDSCVIKPYPPHWFWENWTDSGRDYCMNGQCVSYDCELLSSDYNAGCDPTKELQGKISSLETENSALKSRLGIVEGKNTEQDSSISGLEQENASQGQQIGALGTENLQQSSRIGSLEQENTEQSSDINSLFGENSGLAARVLGLEALAAQQSEQIAGILAEITGIKSWLSSLQQSVDYLSEQVDFITWVLRNRFFGNPADKYKSICDWMKANSKTDATIFGSNCTIVDGNCSCAEVLP